MEVVIFLEFTDSFETRAAELYDHQLPLAIFLEKMIPPQLPQGANKFLDFDRSYLTNSAR